MVFFQLTAKDGAVEEEKVKGVDRLYTQLSEHWGAHGPIGYFEAVLDPDSFGQTIQNMFAVSFLIRVCRPHTPTRQPDTL